MSSFGASSFGNWGASGVVGGGWTDFGYPIANTLPLAPPINPAATVDPQQQIERQSNWAAMSGPGQFPGFDTAPPPSIMLWWQMRRYAIIQLAWAITVEPTLAGVQTIEPVEGADEGLADEMMEAAKEDKLLELIQSGLTASYECLHFGYWGQEIVYDRVNNRTVPVELRSILPFEAQVFCDVYRNFAGYQIGTEYRDARYALWSVNNPHINRVFGESRNSYCRAEWWRSMMSENTADKTERKASGIQMMLEMPQGETFVDGNGKAVMTPEVAQTLANAAARGDVFTVPLTPFSKADIVRNPELAKIPAFRVTPFDHGNIGPALEAHLSRIGALDMKIMQAWRRPTREAMEGTTGTKAEAGVHGQIGVTDSELVAADRMNENTVQIIDRWAATNWGPQAVGVLRVVQAPLSDPQQTFRQSIATAMVTAQDMEFDAQIDRRALAEETELPIVDEDEAEQRLADAQQQQADQQKQKMDAMKAGANGNGKKPMNGDRQLSAEVVDRLSDYFDLSLDESSVATQEGVWRTINGAHVLIKDGVITKGPAHLVGKTTEHAETHGAAPTKAKEGYHRIERNAKGDYVATHHDNGTIEQQGNEE